ncbi:MAG: FxsA family protein [Gammaproteobacteria bacterium]|nr:FxsA family protein [Gammaproteobacteria bacterium]
MRQLLLPLFIIIPIIEIYLLLSVGSIIGVFPTIALIFATAMLGVTLLRHQGLATLKRAQEALQRQEIPTTLLIEGVMILIAGLLLITPGFFTDSIGFLLLLPPLRRRLAMGLTPQLFTLFTPPSQTTTTTKQRSTIEGEYQRLDDR